MRKPGRKSKIVCTLGPAVAGLDQITKLIEAGMDVARLNFSHGSHEMHAQSIAWIREASKNLNIPVAILGDLQGPKIRTGKILGGVTEGSKHFLPLSPGQKIAFVGIDSQPSTPGDGTVQKPISISYARLGQDLRPGELVLFDDGLVRMRVSESSPEKNRIIAVVEHGKALGENKGVNMPDARLSTLGITEKDWDDILFGVSQDIDFFALSFVRSAREVKSLKAFLEQKQAGIHVIAKIEKAEAIQAIDDILLHADGIMVARGDLGVEIGNEHVPLVQKKLIRKARSMGKPVITATQMLMSMVDSPTPSRAEASDVANAVIDGSDALMLSNETATGNYPFDAVTTMSTIILGAESLQAQAFTLNLESSAAENGGVLPVSEAIESAAVTIAQTVRARCLACLTRSGQAARLLAKYRPKLPIYAFAENVKVQKQLCLSWGVSVVPWHEINSQDYKVFDDLLAELKRMGLMNNGDHAIMTAGIPTSRQVGTTNTIVVRKLGAPS